MDSWSPPSPVPIVAGARVLVRTFRKGDGPAMHAAVSASRDLAWLTLRWATAEHPDLDDCVYFVERAARQVAEPDCRSFPMAVVARGDDTVLGGVGFHAIVARESTAEVGYWMRGDRNGEGLCAEAVAAFITSGLTARDRGGWGFRRITLLCAAANPPSRRVAEKLGLRLERRERAERYQASGPTQGYLDTLGYAVLAGEWDFEARRAKPGIAWPA